MILDTSRIEIVEGDARDALKNLAAESFDGAVMDPPYALVSVVARFGKANAAPAKSTGASGVYKRASAGFMGQAWDTGEVAFDPAFWADVLRVLKPGGHLIAFGGTRTYHRLAVAIEDAGFEIRDQIGWLYGSGFPKSHDVSKAIDKALGCERAKVRVDAAKVRNPKATGAGRDGMEGATRPWIEAALERGYHEAASTEAASIEAASWQGWGTALKPAWEPIVLARKPLVGTVAANVLAHGTGALNIDGCRISAADKTPAPVGKFVGSAIGPTGLRGERNGSGDNLGRWPANVIHDGSEEVVAAFPQSESRRATITSKPGGVYGGGKELPSHTGEYGFDDAGSAARFFYSAKAGPLDRLGTKHPTVKPVDLMRWLIRLTVPPGGHVLDCFAGSGTTGVAALAEGRRATLIERDAGFAADIRARLAYLAGEGHALAVRARHVPEAKPLPLFGGVQQESALENDGARSAAATPPMARDEAIPLASCGPVGESGAIPPVPDSQPALSAPHPPPANPGAARNEAVYIDTEELLEIPAFLRRE